MQSFICWFKNCCVERESKKLNEKLDLKKNLAASFQNTVNNILTKKTLVAMKQFKDFSKKKNQIL